MTIIELHIPTVVAPAGLCVHVYDDHDYLHHEVAALAGWQADGTPLVIEPDSGFCMTPMEFVRWAKHDPDGDTWTISIGPWDAVGQSAS